MATIISDPAAPPTMDAYEVILSPGGTGSATAPDGTWLHSYLAAQATLTGTGWNINTEGTTSNLGGFATAGEQDVGGLRTGSSTVITFNVTVPQTGDYKLSVFDRSNSAAADVSGPTNIFARVDGGSPQELWLPVGYNWVIWNHGDTTVHLTAGTHQISLSDDRRRTARRPNGDAIINKIDLQLDDPAVQDSTIYEAEQAESGQRRHADYRAQGQSGAGAVGHRPRPERDFWVYSAADGYADLAFRYQQRRSGRASPSTRMPLDGRSPAAATGAWSTPTDRVYLSAGINKVMVTGAGGEADPRQADRHPVRRHEPGRAAARRHLPGGGRRLTGTAHVDNSYSQANGGVVTGIGSGTANALTLTVHAPAAGTYGMTVRFANNQQLLANHYNPDLMTEPGRHQRQRRRPRSTSTSPARSTGTSSGICTIPVTAAARAPTPSSSSPIRSTTTTAPRSGSSTQAAVSGSRFALTRRRTSTRSPWRRSSSGANGEGPDAEPLLGAVGFEPLYLGEPKLRREAHRAGVGGLGKEHHRLAGKLAGEPAECRCACLGGVPVSPCPRQEQVAELGLPGSSRRTVPRGPAENDLADHGSAKIGDEKAGTRLGRPGHFALELVTRPGATEVGADLWRGQQLDERRPVPGLGLTEHEPLGPDRLRRPGDGSQVGHARRLAAVTSALKDR